jgi:hypothetical protein
MLYVGRCRCGFVVQSEDCQAFKSLMAGHMNRSHGQDYLFVSGVPLKDFEDFTIVRLKDKQTVKLMKAVVGTRGYWKAIRLYPSLRNILFSGLSSGEFKPF